MGCGLFVYTASLLVYYSLMKLEELPPPGAPGCWDITRQRREREARGSLKAVVWFFSSAIAFDLAHHLSEGLAFSLASAIHMAVALSCMGFYCWYLCGEDGSDFGDDRYSLSRTLAERRENFHQNQLFYYNHSYICTQSFAS
ncbi:hypothetical protein MLD38_034753 [Melastoma candidum]|uniref:Uncharacterized protein n=1 Tax=Melastoma candidum TaxID=119954 RepID=A0ACB9MEE7_9MYRT|nr:hypothetical protein MLD38_034753 [Melastoma candidum]